MKPNIQRWAHTACFVVCFGLMSWMMFSRSYFHPVPFPLIYSDEQGHYSYTEYLRQQDRLFPDFADFPLYDAVTRAPRAEPNFLNHPPLFYWLMKAVHQHFPQNDNPLRYRLVPLAIDIVFIGIYFFIGWQLRLSLGGGLAYLLLPFLLQFELFGGMYSNDAFAFLGGGLVCLGSMTWLHKPQHTSKALGLMMFGLFFASVKFTAFLLMGLYLCFLLWPGRARLSPSMRLFGLAFLSLISAPYLYFLAIYGSPAPNTPGHIYILVHGLYAGMPRMDFFDWILRFMHDLGDQHEGWELTPLVLFWWLGAAFFVKMPTVRAASLATGIMLTIHLCFSYQRYQTYGWLQDAFLRYYFPLMPIYGLTLALAYERVLESLKRNAPRR